jgi:hypothetical protein
MRRPLLALLVLATATACAGGGDGADTGASGAPATAAPAGGTTISGPDERTYVVAKPGERLELDDLTARLVKFRWRRDAPVAAAPPGTRAYAEATIHLANTGRRPAVVRPTQIWLVDGAGNTYLPAARADLPDGLVGRRIAPGAAATGRVLFPTPARGEGSVLVYRFADAEAIARATRAGLLEHR